MKSIATIIALCFATVFGDDKTTASCLSINKAGIYSYLGLDVRGILKDTDCRMKWQIEPQSDIDNPIAIKLNSEYGPRYLSSEIGRFAPIVGDGELFEMMVAPSGRDILLLNKQRNELLCADRDSWFELDRIMTLKWYPATHTDLVSCRWRLQTEEENDPCQADESDISKSNPMAMCFSSTANYHAIPYYIGLTYPRLRHPTCGVAQKWIIQEQTVNGSDKTVAIKLDSTEVDLWLSSNYGYSTELGEGELFEIGVNAPGGSIRLLSKQRNQLLCVQQDEADRVMQFKWYPAEFTFYTPCHWKLQTQQEADPCNTGLNSVVVDDSIKITEEIQKMDDINIQRERCIGQDYFKDLVPFSIETKECTGFLHKWFEEGNDDFFTYRSFDARDRRQIYLGAVIGEHNNDVGEGEQWTKVQRDGRSFTLFNRQRAEFLCTTFDPNTGFDTELLWKKEFNNDIDFGCLWYFTS